MLPEFFDFFLVHTFLTTLVEEGVQSNVGSHVDRATTFFQLIEHQVVTQTGRGNRRSSIRHEFLQLALNRVAIGIELAKTVLNFSFEQEEPSTNRSITIFKTGRGETILHHGQCSTDLGTHGVGGTSVPYRIPGTTFTLT